MQFRMVCSSKFSTSLLRSLVLISFMALKERSTVAGVTGNTFTIAATFAMFGKAVVSSGTVRVTAVYQCREHLLQGAVFVPHKNDSAKNITLS